MSTPEKHPEPKAAKPKGPLYMRLYFQAVYYGIVRMVGYGGIPLAEARTSVRALESQFGKDKLAEAADELLDISAEFVRLKPEVRRLAHQLLGPAPETPSVPQSNDKQDSVTAPPENRSARPAVKGPKKAKTKAATKPQAKDTPGGKATPLMDQYRAAKEKHPGMILLFRIGDFYEVFDDDAELCHRLLGLTLTTRDREATMAGFPHHQLETYLHKLLNAGQRVAVCDQDDSDANTVRRSVTRVVTPASPIESHDKPVKQPRHFVLKQYEEWLNAEGFAFVAVADAKKATPAIAPYIGGLDYIVLRDDEKLLVTVRPSLQAKHVNAMRELQKLFGPEYMPTRIWPVEGPNGWHWQEHPIAVSAEAAS